MASKYYLDSSAYLCILLGEKGSEALARQVAGGTLFSSVLLVLEVHRTLVRLSREGLIAPAEFQACRERLTADLDHMILRDLTLDLCKDPPMPVVTTPLSLDLVHLRTALWFHGRDPLSLFVTLDEPQKQAARELGLPV